MAIRHRISLFLPSALWSRLSPKKETVYMMYFFRSILPIPPICQYTGVRQYNLPTSTATVPSRATNQQCHVVLLCAFGSAPQSSSSSPSTSAQLAAFVINEANQTNTRRKCPTALPTLHGLSSSSFLPQGQQHHRLKTRAAGALIVNLLCGER
ncbi:hypothetical protein IWZ00DRAFT_39642 [Phyllosticta capitalensis]